MSKQGRPSAPRDPESATRLGELLERLGRNPGALVKGFDTPGRKLEAQIRDWVRNLRAPLPESELSAILEQAGVKERDACLDFVYRAAKKPSWWATRSNPGIGERPVVKPAEPLGADPLSGVLKAAVARRLTVEEARSAIVALAKSGLLGDDATGGGVRGSRWAGDKLSALLGPRRIIKLDDVRNVPRLPKKRPARCGAR